MEFSEAEDRVPESCKSGKNRRVQAVTSDIGFGGKFDVIWTPEGKKSCPKASEVTQTNSQAKSIQSVIVPHIWQQCGHQSSNRRSEVQRRLDKLNRPVPTKAVFIVCRFLTNNF
ncbi:hypothetical protein MTP99_013895 [Tenebrio molitor]|jgi:hypothetical protein|nr:hypothetical protein MTP99_013895 [Tenebrio molitor]